MANNLPKVTRPTNGRASIWSLLQKPVLFPTALPSSSAETAPERFKISRAGQTPPRWRGGCGALLENGPPGTKPPQIHACAAPSHWIGASAMARLADSARRKRPSGTSSPWETCHAHTESLQWCPTLRGPTDCSPAGRSVHGTLQAGMLEGLPGPPSGGPFWPRDRTCVAWVSCTGCWVLFHWRHLGSPPELPLSLRTQLLSANGMLWGLRPHGEQRPLSQGPASQWSVKPSGLPAEPSQRAKVTRSCHHCP